MDAKFYTEAEKLLAFIEKSPCCFFAVENTSVILEEHGYKRLYENKKWSLSAGGKYYVTRNASSILAFQIPADHADAFRIVCSHTDSPSFKIKENPEMLSDGKYVKLNVEKYGGMLCAPWFDRPLSVAGRVMVKTEEGIESRLVHLDRDLLMIPNLAIHMNREANDGYKYNVQTDLCPVFGDETAKEGFAGLIAEAAGCTASQILGTDLFLYNRQKGTFIGADREFIGSPRLDDLQCMYASLQGFLNAEFTEGIPVFAAFDNEETGSMSRQGADSTFLKETLKRINRSLGQDEEAYYMAIAGSFLISADNAHAVHPNHTDKSDPVNRPQMNHGVVVKFNANQKYTTDARSYAVFRMLCDRADVPSQVFTNRSDMAGGSTLGNISNTQVSMQSVDIGLAQLAMHSPYEMAGTKDTSYLMRVMKEFYSTTIRFNEETVSLS